MLIARRYPMVVQLMCDLDVLKREGDCCWQTASSGIARLAVAARAAMLSRRICWEC